MISVIKMNVVPRILFLFQTISVVSGTGDFKEWQKDISRFIWQEEKPRMKCKMLIDSKDRGGFSLPGLKLYYEASSLCWLQECNIF